MVYHLQPYDKHEHLLTEIYDRSGLEAKVDSTPIV